MILGYLDPWGLDLGDVEMFRVARGLGVWWLRNPLQSKYIAIL